MHKAVFVDSRPVLLAALEERTLRIGALFKPDNHLNELGNTIVAAEVARTLKEVWGPEL